MVYSYDNWVQLPTKDIYDTQMMAMAINAAKDMYEKGQDEIKDFTKTYGDFMSPFAKDMERYGEMVGGVRDTINRMYAAGIDPLRSAEGRAMLSRLTNSINPAEFNMMRTNAKLGFEYLSKLEEARAADQFDEDYENWLLQQEGAPGLFNEFSSEGGKMWNRPAPARITDINKWTHHLFDNMELSYDPELSKQYPGFMAYTKSKDTMNQIVDQNIAGLLNSNIGKYRLHQIEQEIPLSYVGDRRAAAIEELKRRIVNSNWEEGQVKLETDPYYYLKMQAALRPRTGSGSGSGRKLSLEDAVDSAEGLFYRGLVHSGGTDDYEDVIQAIDDARYNIMDRQVELQKQAANLGLKGEAADNYILDNLSIEEPHSDFFDYAQVTANDDGSFIIDDKALENLFSNGSVVSHMYGLDYEPNSIKKKKRQYTDRSGLKGLRGFPRRKVTTAFDQKANGQYALRQFWEVEIGDYEKDRNGEDTGNFKVQKVMRYELPTSRQESYNMPSYLKSKTMSLEERRVAQRPSLRQNLRTKGLKNAGSNVVNKKRGVTAKASLNGTINEEAIETE